MNWYEILQNKDHSISSCKRVSDGMRDGKFVHYVQANSPEEAIDILMSRYRLQVAKGRKQLEERVRDARLKGLCTGCCKVPPADGKVWCQPCLNRKAEYSKRRRRGETRPRASEQERALQWQAKRLTKRREAQRQGAYCQSDIRHRLLVRCLQAFDTMTPRSFRSWLVEEINKAQQKAQAAKQKRASRFQQPEVTE